MQDLVFFMHFVNSGGRAGRLHQVFRLFLYMTDYVDNSMWYDKMSEKAA